MMTWLVIGAVFVGATACVGAVLMILRGQGAPTVESRLDLLTGAATAGGRGDSLVTGPGALLQLQDDAVGLLGSLSKALNLRTYLEQADSSLTPSKLLLISGGMAGGGFCAGMFTGHALIGSPVAALIGGSLPFLWVWLKRKLRLAKFGRQLPETLELVARALRAGHSLGAGIKLAVDEMADPVKKEFGRCYEEQNLGVPLEEALENLADRIPNLDLRFFVTAVTLQRQTGGDLAEILDKIGWLVRERYKIFGQVAALTGEGRLSGIVLLALPPVLFIVMYRLNAEYVMMLFTDPLGQKMLAAAAVMQILGAIVIQKIISIKV